MFGGGAIYLAGERNVFLNMKSCQIIENVSPCGGAIRRHRHAQVVTGKDSVIQPVEQKQLPNIDALSPREKEVLELLLKGKQRSEIATVLFISENTVKKNISSIYSKLNVSSRSELFALFK